MPAPLIIGNWKMHGSIEQATQWATELRQQALGHEYQADVVICPAFAHLSIVGHHFVGTDLKLGAQDCHQEDSGAYTGDVSAGMLKDLGCAYVIVGHSERRSQHQETDALVKDKARAAHKAGLQAVICIGENQHQRDKGRTLDIIRGQLNGSLPETATSGNTVLAYEPVWAIGTGKAALVQEIVPVFKFLKQQLKECFPNAADCRLLYGGSVTPENVKEFVSAEAIAGVLVGGVSLKPEAFWKLVTSC